MKKERWRTNMKKLIVVGTMTLLLLVGCTKYENGECVSGCDEPFATEENVTEGTLENALEKLKHVEVIDVVDSRDSTGQLTLELKISNKIGAGTQVSNVIQRTPNFLKALDNKPENLTVRIIQNDTLVTQFSTNGTDIEIEKVIPEVERVLNK
jgi:hypothetical protein